MRGTLLLSIGFASGLVSSSFAQSELSIRMVPAITLTGQSGVYAIQRADVLGATTNWTTITNITLSEAFTFYDTSAPILAQRFYRAIQDTLINSNTPTTPQLVWLQPGTFVMGSPTTEENHYFSEEPQTTVILSRGFWIGKYEVTQKEFLAVMGSNPSNWQGESLPVERVTWFDATNYCAMLTVSERAAGRLPAGYAYRLPTEAEWEYACRAGTSTATAFGDNLSSTQANFAGNFPYGAAAKGPSLNRTSNVGSFAPNSWGIFDMHGNVREWCLESFDSNYPGGTVIDPRNLDVNVTASSSCILRGGCWVDIGSYCRSARRTQFPSDGRNWGYGFRVVLAPDS